MYILNVKKRRKKKRDKVFLLSIGFLHFHFVFSFTFSRFICFLVLYLSIYVNCHNPCDSLLLLFHCLLGKHVFDYVIHLLNLSRITVRFEKRENVKVSLAIDDLHHSTHSTLLSVVETVLYVSVNKSLSAERPRFLCSDLIQVSVKIHPNNWVFNINVHRFIILKAISANVSTVH